MHTTDSREPFHLLTARNRAVLERMFDPQHRYGRECVRAIADGARCRLIGTTLWSGSFANKFDWASNVFFALPRELDGDFSITAHHILVAGELACVRARGRATLRNGVAYNNEYCLVYRFAHGVIVELTEYLDTALITEAFGTRGQHRAQPSLAPGVMERFPAVIPASYASSSRATPVESAPAHLRLVQGLFEAPAGTWLDACRSLLAPSAVCRLPGTTRFGGVYQGREALVEQVLRPLAGALEGGLTLIADCVFAHDDWVVVQARGLGRTRTGRRYDNDYCLWFRVADGAVVELIAYYDTALVTWAFGV